MKIHFFGVRGSYDVPKAKMMKYGGHTSSVVVTKKVNGITYPLFIDAGTGIIDAGKSFIPMFFEKNCPATFTILFSHLHPDHTSGFTFFPFNFIPGVKLNLLGPSTLKKNVGIVLRDKMAPPTYPIEYKDLKSERIHGVVEDGTVFWIDKTGNIDKNGPKMKEGPNSNFVYKADSDFVYKIQSMAAYAPSHPQQGAIYYRVTDCETGKSVVSAWDLESRAGGDQRVIAFSKDADVMIHDTQYTEEEYKSNKMVVQGFGHSTYEMAIENAEKAGVKTLVPFHYNPNHTDDDLDNIAAKITESKNNLQVFFAKENHSLEL